VLNCVIYKGNKHKSIALTTTSIHVAFPISAVKDVGAVPQAQCPL
jgi:hypothetical protein